MIFEHLDSLWDRAQAEYNGLRKIGMVTQAPWPQDSRLVVFLERFKEHCDSLIVTVGEDWELAMVLHCMKPVDHVFYHDAPDSATIITAIKPRVLGTCEIVQPTDNELKALSPVGCKLQEISLKKRPVKKRGRSKRRYT